MNKSVNYKIAKLLVEKNITIFSSMGNVTLLYDKNGNVVPYTNYGFLYSGMYDEYISAPTIATVVMWLYEKHGIWIYISDGTARLEFRYQIQRLKVLGENNFSSDVRYKSPKEAYEKAIEYCLNNLIK